MHSLQSAFQELANKLKQIALRHGAFFGILSGAAVVYCFVIARISPEGDASHYAFRALGWLDWFTGQEGPLKFVGHHEWWMDISFQDHPPAVFFIQHYFFKLFGETTFVALLPSAIAGLLTLIVIYWGMSRLADREMGLWAVFFVASDALATRMFTDGFHEGVTTFFIVASFVLLLLYLETDKKAYALVGAAVLGLSILSKYTAVFGVAGFFTALVSGGHLTFPIKRVREQMRLVCACAVACAVVLMPVIVYNFFLFKSVHLLDTSLAMTLGANNLFHDHATLNLPMNLFFTVQSLLVVDNPLFIVSSLCAIAWLFVKGLREKTSNFERGLLIYTAFLFFMFAFMGSANRYIPIFIPFLALLVAVLVIDVRKRVPGRLSLVGIGVFAMFAVGYNLNTHVIPRPFGWTGITFSEERGRDFGLNNLDAYLRAIIGPVPELKKPTTIQEIFSTGLPVASPSEAKEIIIFDERFNFFAMWWYLERYTLFHRVPLYPSSAGISQRLLGGPSFDRSVLPTPETPVYYIEVLDKAFMNPHQIGNPWPEFLARLFAENKVPYDAISDLQGQPAFRVYKLNP